MSKDKLFISFPFPVFYLVQTYSKSVICLKSNKHTVKKPKTHPTKTKTKNAERKRFGWVEIGYMDMNYCAPLCLEVKITHTCIMTLGYRWLW